MKRNYDEIGEEYAAAERILDQRAAAYRKENTKLQGLQMYTMLQHPLDVPVDSNLAKLRRTYKGLYEPENDPKLFLDMSLQDVRFTLAIFRSYRANLQYAAIRAADKMSVILDLDKRPMVLPHDAILRPGLPKQRRVGGSVIAVPAGLSSAKLPSSSVKVIYAELCSKEVKFVKNRLRTMYRMPSSSVGFIPIS